MLDHTGFVLTDLARARRFYDAVAEALGLGTIDIGDEAFLLGCSAQEPTLSMDRYQSSLLLDAITEPAFAAVSGRSHISSSCSGAALSWPRKQFE